MTKINHRFSPVLVAGIMGTFIFAAWNPAPVLADSPIQGSAYASFVDWCKNFASLPDAARLTIQCAVSGGTNKQLS